MKKSIDGHEISPRVWYYLLDFNDRDNWQIMQTKFNQMRLLDLTKGQIVELFKIATEQDLSDLTK